jgi:rubrerythrin
MPVQECNENNKPGYRYGESGKCYTYTAGNEESRKRAKQQAHIQGAAIESHTGEDANKSVEKYGPGKGRGSAGERGGFEQCGGEAVNLQGKKERGVRWVSRDGQNAGQCHRYIVGDNASEDKAIAASQADQDYWLGDSSGDIEHQTKATVPDIAGERGGFRPCGGNAVGPDGKPRGGVKWMSQDGSKQGPCHMFTPGDEASENAAIAATEADQDRILGRDAQDDYHNKAAEEKPDYSRFIDDGEGLVISDSEEDTEKDANFVDSAIADEKSGIEEYSRAIENTKDENEREAFSDILEDEKRHLEILEGLKVSYGNEEYTGEQEEEKSCCKKSVYVPIKKVNEVLRWVTGVVLEPNTVDLQGDVISAEDIRKAMEGYMLKSQAVGRQHKEVAKAAVVECYLAPCDFMLDGRELVRKGSWVLSTKIFDEGIWKDVQSGAITGYSIGGSGVRSNT